MHYALCAVLYTQATGFVLYTIIYQFPPLLLIHLQEILAEVRHRREKGVKRESEIVGVGGKKSVQKETKKEVKLNDLASKVKWKFSKVR